MLTKITITLRRTNNYFFLKSYQNSSSIEILCVLYSRCKNCTHKCMVVQLQGSTSGQTTIQNAEYSYWQEKVMLKKKTRRRK